MRYERFHSCNTSLSILAWRWRRSRACWRRAGRKSTCSACDLCLGSLPVFWIQDPRYLLNAAGVAFITFFIARIRELPVTVLLVADAFVLALFTMTGAEKALSLHAAPAIVVTMGVITGVAGGVLRDALTGEIPLVFRPQIYLYATASLAGVLVFVLLNYWLPDIRTNMIAAIVVTLSLRLGAIRWKLSLPEFDSKRPEAEA
jgi:uncharacterized membrane protein YeiH